EGDVDRRYSREAARLPATGLYRQELRSMPPRRGGEASAEASAADAGSTMPPLHPPQRAQTRLDRAAVPQHPGEAAVRISLVQTAPSNRQSCAARASPGRAGYAVVRVERD